MDVADFETARNAMVDTQIATASVTDPRLLAAFRRLPRERFLPGERRTLAYSDVHHPLGNGRFLPAPAVVARLLQLADINQAQQVLDYWPATGYTTCIMAGLAGEVVAIEPDPGLAETACQNLAALSVTNAAVVTSEAVIAADRTFDLVFLEAAVSTVPQGLLDRLSIGGRLVCLLRRGPIAVATVHERTRQAIVTRTAFNATLPGIDASPAEETFVF